MSPGPGGRPPAASPLIAAHEEAPRVGTALRAGFRRALEAGAEAVVKLDADGQHDPADQSERGNRSSGP